MSDTQDYYEYAATISSGGGNVYGRAEGSNEYLQFVFRREADIPVAEREAWGGPYHAGDQIRVVFPITLD